MSEKNLKWRFDVNTFRLIGRELITDRITAVYELVKNCYDANATKVIVEFIDVSPEALNEKSKIIISDDGHGMSYTDIRDKWMVVGTASKRSTLFSPPPFERRYVGEKGIGRFAVDKLGGHVVIETKEVDTNQKLVVNIDWNAYDELSKSPQLKLFTDVENSYAFVDAPKEEKGTKLIISSIEETWTDLDINRLEKELEKIVSPFHPLNPPFQIVINSNEYDAYKDKPVKAESIKYSSLEFKLEYNVEKEWQETLKWDKEKNKIIVDRVSIKPFGGINLRLFYFDEAAKKKFNRIYKNQDYRIDGIKIYRDGLITTPFAEFEGIRDKKRDVLGIDKRLWSGFLDKVGTREIIGILDITKENNPKIIDSTNRQDFVDNEAYRELKEFVIAQLKVLEEFKKNERKLLKQKVDQELVKANIEVKEFTEALKTLEKNNPNLKQTLKPLKEQAKVIDISIKKGIEQQEKERKEYIRKENIYVSLMSLQDYAIHVSHAVRTALGKVKRMAEFFKDRFPDPKLDSIFKEYSHMIYNEMVNLNKVIDFMLSYAGSNIDMEDFNVKNHLEDLFNKAYVPVFDAEDIKHIVEVQDNFVLHANKKFFEDIFENLISNSIKALRNEESKVIKCSGFIEDDHFVIYYSDNGEGIRKGDEEKIFEMYYTTTADLGGAGIGLYIVKTRVESLRGTISVVENEFKPRGATFKISFPFKK
ncbi:ATP-binding protein [Muricauda ruestringensis]|uniref:histidine kinase n=1 Tax=Flagellimonas aurea TaxID=2915619 RepID=A0ABS3GC76_9FLAO|nr:sensor histidine kinase [Allomuricauda aurea]MBO0356217.1 ATP-binding protein [Allomuricauda aurea]